MASDISNKRLPDAFIVGAAKSGTTSLYQMLASHSGLFFPKGEKEPFFFCFANKKPEGLESSIIDRVTWEEEKYFELYANAPKDAVAIDASTAYLYRYEETIAHMKQYYGKDLASVKIIMLLRNPVERAWSHYLYLVRNGHEPHSFEEALDPQMIEERKERRWGFDYLGYGAYGAQVAAFVKAFPNTLICFTEDLRDHNTLLSRVHDFLGVAHIPHQRPVKANPSGVPKNRFLVAQLRKNKWLKKAVNKLPERLKHKVLAKRDVAMAALLEKTPLAEATRHKLRAYYEKDIQIIETLTGRNLSAWKK